MVFLRHGNIALRFVGGSARVARPKRELRPDKMGGWECKQTSVQALDLPQGDCGIANQSVGEMPIERERGMVDSRSLGIRPDIDRVGIFAVRHQGILPG